MYNQWDPIGNVEWKDCAHFPLERAYWGGRVPVGELLVTARRWRREQLLAGHFGEAAESGAGRFGKNR